MIGLILLTHKNIGLGLLEAVQHTLGSTPPRMVVIGVDYHEPTDAVADRLAEGLAQLDESRGVLILADVYGATHTNIACRRLARGRVELITGVNLPMLLRVLNYRGLPMDELIDRALSGGCGGIVCAGRAEEAPGKSADGAR